MHYIKRTVGKVFSGSYRTLAIFVALLGMVALPLANTKPASASMSQCSSGLVCLWESPNYSNNIANFLVSKNTCYDLSGMYLDNKASSLYNHTNFRVQFYSNYHCAGPTCHVIVNAQDYRSNLLYNNWDGGTPGTDCYGLGDTNNAISSFFVFL